MTTPDSDSAEPFGGSDPPSAPLTFRAPISNCAKSIIDRKLRKFASETSFATETASESSLEREVPSRSRIFTVRPVLRANGGPRRKRHDSDASGSAGSEATVASGAATPRRGFRRPKSSGEMHTSCTSATIHSLESGHVLHDERRPSHVYMIDDDSVHEFEEDDAFSLEITIDLTVNTANGPICGHSALNSISHRVKRWLMISIQKSDGVFKTSFFGTLLNFYSMSIIMKKYYNISDEYDNVTLMYAKHEKIPMKDFGSEIRATMDIDHLLNKAVLLLDLQETSLEEIFAKIIHEMDIQEPEFTSEQVRGVLFTQDAGNQFHILSRTVQSICTTGSIGGTFDYDQTWICALCMLNTVQHRHVAIARLSHPTNLGRTMQDLRFIIIVIAPSRAKGTKTALETTRTFATLFADMEIRQRLVMAQTVEQFRSTLLSAAKELAMDQNQWRERKTSIHLSQAKEQIFGPNAWYPFRGLKEEFKRRLAVYPSDFTDGVSGHRTMQKLFSTVVFLYFACLLPAIAFGVLNDDNTNGGINVRKVITAQAIGGIFFSIFGGQPMIILLTTVPLAIYIKVIYKISQELGYDFFAMYACVGLFCQLFLVLYSATELCSLMKLATRSAEEMFSLFIAIAFTVESIRAIHNIFIKNYSGCDDVLASSRVVQEALKALRNGTSSMHINNITSVLTPDAGVLCRRDTSILYMLLMFGTLWLGLFLYNFRKTPYLTRSRREWLADYALPASVLIMSFTGSYCFSDIAKDRFNMREEVPIVHVADIFSLPPSGYFVCLLLGFSLSFLFFMDQNITSAIVNNPQNKALADVEERVSQGHVHEVIMNVRETRLATLIAHVMILISTFYLIPYPLQLIPTSVLHGLFLYMALTSLSGNEMFERLLLLITEQQAYPPTHYIRKVPQRKVHLFTACQLLQLVILCAFGFSPYPFIEMVFPIVCFFFLPIRYE
uniref:HCO3_cotransp domain-containing protein n=1 Tax=Heterorhabditis bacteriophora TaxID=37862 RepID=A0A1I7XHB8_HETBA